MKKYLLFALLFVTCLLPVRAEIKSQQLGNIESNKEFNVVDNGHGEFISNSALKLNSGSESVIIEQFNDEIYQIKHNSITSDKMIPTKFLMVKEGVFIPVDEIVINLNDLNGIKKTIREYNINSYIARDIYKAAEMNDGKTIVTATFYTPVKGDEINNTTKSVSSVSSLSKVYYTGYKNGKYLDEVLSLTQVGQMQSVKKGTATKNYITTVIKNFGNAVINGVAKYYTGTSYTIAKIFFPNISDFTPYAANTADFWQAALNERKYIKYTSVQVYDSATNKYVYICRAIGAKEYMNFKHFFYIKTLMTESKSMTDPEQLYMTPNYNSLDVKAYERMYDTIPYEEMFTKWSPNKYTWFASIMN